MIILLLSSKAEGDSLGDEHFDRKNRTELSKKRVVFVS